MQHITDGWGILRLALLLTILVSLSSGASAEELITYGEPSPLPLDGAVHLPTITGGLEELEENATYINSDKSLGRIFKKQWWKDTWLVYLSITIDESGRVKAVDVAIPSGSPDFDAHMQNQALHSQLRYSPGTVAGIPAGMRVLLPVSQSDHDRSKLETLRFEARGRVEEWSKERDAENEKLRQRVIAERNGEILARRARYAAEAPYRLLPAKALTNSEMAIRQLQAIKFFAYCGSSVFVKYPFGIAEQKGTRIHVTEEEKLSEIDVMNGYQWKGIVTVTATYGRFAKDGIPLASADWTNGYEMNYWVTKRRGEWSVYVSDVDEGNVPIFMTCKEIRVD